MEQAQGGLLRFSGRLCSKACSGKDMAYSCAQSARRSFKDALSAPLRGYIGGPANTRHDKGLAVPGRIEEM